MSTVRKAINRGGFVRALLLDSSLAKILFWLTLLIASGAFAADDDGNALVRELQQGGYVIFFRHAGTNSAIKDIDTKNLTNCATQRNLTSYGRQQSQMIGDAFKSLKISVGEIFTSEYCRCVDTARIAFGRASPVPSLSSYMTVSDIEKQQRVQSIRRLLNTVPAPGTNTVIVSHHFMFEDASGITLAEGEAAIFKPGAPEKGLFIARIPAEGWSGVVQHYMASTQP